MPKELTPQNPCAADVPDSQRGKNMSSTNITILYERLSREDESENESVSIENQKSYLEEYAIKNGFKNMVHMTDDGWSGTRWDRPGFQKMMEQVEIGCVDTILIKNMSRLGRDHLRVGLYLEMLRDKGVRLIAVAEAIDTSKGEDDFMPFRNIIAEWHARDTSCKIKAIFGAKTAQGHHVSGAIPYGYIHNPQNHQEWLLDKEAAPIVKRMFQSIINGKSPTQITAELTAEKVLTPAAHWEKIGAGMKKPHNANSSKWGLACVLNILKRREYIGWKILNKSTKENYKQKRRKETPLEDMLVFKDAYPAIIDEETWSVVQRLRGTKRCPYQLAVDTDPLTGVLYCADCGKKMYHKRGYAGEGKPPHHEYVCSSYRHYSKVCTCHYIRVKVVQDLILTAIKRISKYVSENEAEFVERVRQNSALQQEALVRENRGKHAKAKRRRDEVGLLIKKLYESFALDKIPEKHFTELLADYDAEQSILERQISDMEAAIKKYNTV